MERKLRPGGAAGVLSSTWGALWLAQDTRTSAALVPNRWLQGAEPLYSKICVGARRAGRQAGWEINIFPTMFAS
uniref:Uncharacterized protein n=1 Tax=Aegilops tauschii subsp. strangulata TaxID=200361 RepID=A0A453PRM3_AEGTS